MEILNSENPEALTNEKAYQRICRLLRLMIHPDLGCCMKGRKIMPGY